MAGEMSHMQFVRDLWPVAQKVGAEYGLDPTVIMTQAVQETHWGTKVAGNNYFGVKSHGQPGGIDVVTHEVINGKRVKMTENFRQYSSIEDSARDYAQFLKSNPRYSGVFQQKGYENQLKAIAAAGYATDPEYGTKLQAVAKSVNRRVALIPPGEISNVVGTELDVSKVAPIPAPKSAANAARTNAVLDSFVGSLSGKQAPVPEPRIKGTAARAKEEMAKSGLQKAMTQAKNQGTTLYNVDTKTGQVLLPVIGPTGDGKKPAQGPLTKSQQLAAKTEAVLLATNNVALNQNKVNGVSVQPAAPGSKQSSVVAPVPASVEAREAARSSALNLNTLVQTPVKQQVTQAKKVQNTSSQSSSNSSSSSSSSSQQTVQGSATGQNYNVGQTYQSGGYVYKATESGFQKVGKA